MSVVVVRIKSADDDNDDEFYYVVIIIISISNIISIISSDIGTIVIGCCFSSSVSFNLPHYKIQ